MAVPSDPALLVLHTLRLKSFVDADVVANAARLPDHVAGSTLDELCAAGFVAYRNGRISGWSLTTAGRIEGERRLAEEVDAAGCRAVITAAYQRFQRLNRRFLVACTRWQLRVEDGTHFVNDHSDPAYDASVIAELDAIDDAVQPICQDLAAAIARFGYYNGRFAAARVRVHAGEHDWFTMPVIDSYHTVWFELHENLLATLNLERSDETQ
jgi:hypothetical protein